MDRVNPQKDYNLTSPVQYANREGILEDCGRLIIKWGSKALVSGGKRALNAVENKLFPALDASGILWKKSLFAGECCDENIDLISKKAERIGADIIIGVGGGKSIDASKAAAEGLGLPVVCVPTIAATCAASSPISVVYTVEGVHKRDQYLEKNPNLVLVDPEIIANAPVELFESGILDSLSKWYEGRAAFERIKEPDVYTMSAIHLSSLLNDIMEKDAEAAANAVKNKQVTPSMIRVTDLNIYLAAVIQSIGKMIRGAAAHCIHSGLSVIEESHSILHGFKVAYGIVVQLYMEGKEKDEILRVASFFRKLGLEPSFKGMRLPYKPELVRAAAEKSLLGDTMKFLPFEVKVEHIISAMENVEADFGGLV